MNRMLEWFIRNGIAANLLMVLILGAGALSMVQIKKEVFPEVSLDIVQISVEYLGASPEEVEEGVCVRIEEQIQGLDGIKRITSVASENIGVVTVEVLLGYDLARVLDDVKARIDAIDTFPEQTEKPIIAELLNRQQVVDIAISGDTDERTLKVLANRVRDDLTSTPAITQATIVSSRPYELSIEISENAMRRYKLTFDDVARAVRRSSLDLPAGSLRTEGGEILLRTKGQAYRQEDFASLVLRTRADGTRLLLGDVATIVDGFRETDQSARFNGKPAVVVKVFRIGNQSALSVAAAVEDYVKSTVLPEGITLTTWQDSSLVLKSRLNLLLRNGRAGFLLVFLILALFLRFRLAVWVTLGVPISFLGALVVMPSVDVSINLISLFGFIVVLGIVVDDAIVVGENIYTHQQKGEDKLQGAIHGVQEVATPVIFAVLTTVVAFAPLTTVPGNIGKLMRVLPLVVIPCLLFSLVESLIILPNHLSHTPAQPNKTPHGMFSWWQRFQNRFASGFEQLVLKVYRPSLELTLRWRYLAIAIGLALLMFTGSLIASRMVRFTFFPDVEADYVAAMLTMPQGTSVEVTAQAVRRLEASAEQMRRELNGDTLDDSPVIVHMFAAVGEQPYRTGQSQNAGGVPGNFTGGHLGEVTIELAKAENRTIGSKAIAERWRELTGPIPDAEELTYTSALFSVGEAINVQITGLDINELQEASERIQVSLLQYPGVFDIASSFLLGKKEVRLKILPQAESLGLTLSDLARQVRQAFYGEEAQRVQRGRDDVRVMVRYPAENRRSLGDLEQMRIRTPSGAEVPFSEVAVATLGRGFATIQRTNRRRSINITADVDITRADVNVIRADLAANVLPTILADYDGLDWTYEGQAEEQRQTMGGLARGFLFALLLIYGMMAIPFRSYLQPFIVMSAIPFGLIGAIWGHVIMRMDLTIMSMFGIVALTGVVVNDSLVLVDFVNKKRAEGLSMVEAARVAGRSRFRPIFLTSMTTFAGLTPLLLERSVQAQFLVPMAVSLGFGVLFSTMISLLLVPSIYLIIEDVKSLPAWLYGSGSPGASAPDPSSTAG
jgi:multidrug efflux pump subunit AcrB